MSRDFIDVAMDVLEKQDQPYCVIMAGSEVKDEHANVYTLYNIKSKNTDEDDKNFAQSKDFQRVLLLLGSLDRMKAQIMKDYGIIENE